MKIRQNLFVLDGNKQRSFQKGFTLIELLVVIGIIAILVTLVVVAINPVQRLNDAASRRAESNVRSVASVIGICITQEAAELPPANTLNVVYTNNATRGCANANVLAKYGNLPPIGSGSGQIGLGFDANGTAPVTRQICVWSLGGGGIFYRWQTSTGIIDSGPGTGPDPFNSCPDV